MLMKLFRTDLTGAGRPVLLTGEVERGMLDKVDLVFHGPGGVEEHPADEYKDGYVVLTNYRLIWMSSRSGPDGVPCHLPLPAVGHAEVHGGVAIFKAARMKLQVRVDDEAYPTPDPRSVARLAPLKMVCRGPSPDTLHSLLTAALQRQAWAAAPPGLLQQLHPTPGLAAAAGGVQPGRVGPRQPGERPQSEAAAGLQPSGAIVEGLCAIGYPRLHAVNAVVATQNAGVQAAVNWLCDNEGSPALSQPSPFLPDSGSSSRDAGSQPPPGPLAAGAVVAGPRRPEPSGDSFSNPLLAGQGPQPGAPSSSGWGFGAAPGGGASGAGLSNFGSGSSLGVQRSAPSLGVGVAGILKQEEMRAARTDATMDQAFGDLRALMAKAGEMVALAEYFRQRVGAGAASAAEGSGAGEEELDAQTALELLDLGIVVPVTRETAGSLYHRELARQLADFLAAPLARAGGIMPLPDVYCLYNRARGTELVSPDDLLRAVALFEQVGAPLSLREFSSGVKVVQSTSHSDEAICRRLAEMARPRPAGEAPAAGAGAGAGAAVPAPVHVAGDGEVAAGAAHTGAAAAAAGQGQQQQQQQQQQQEGEGERPELLASLGPALTRVEVAVALNVSVAIAGEHLRTAEARGVLCRDEGPHGLVYYRSFFSDPGIEAW